MSQDRKLTSLLGDLMMGMHTKTFEELRRHLPYVETQLSTLRTELADFRGEVTADVKELKQLVLRLLMENGDPRKQLEGERRVHRAPSSALLKLAQRLVKDELDDSEVAQILPQCRPENRVGKGSFGTVYRGTFCGIPVAIKEVDIGELASHANLPLSPCHGAGGGGSLGDAEPGAGPGGLTVPRTSRAVSDFRAEVAVLRLLRSSRLVQFVGACTRPPTLLIITEFVAGGNLYKFLRSARVKPEDDYAAELKHDFDCVDSGRTPRSLPTVADEKHVEVENRRHSSAASACAHSRILDNSLRLQIAFQIAFGLSYLHQHKPPIIHRDLKSRNVLLDEGGNAKICDFGLSRTMTYSVLSVSASLGTPQYMSPEALRAQPLGPKSDVYSYGVLLYEIFTGHIPWERLSLVQIVTRVLVENDRIVIPERIPKSIRFIIENCLEHDVEKRFDIATVLHYLRKVELDT